LIISWLDIIILKCAILPFYATKRALGCVEGQNRRENYHISLHFISAQSVWISVIQDFHLGTKMFEFLQFKTFIWAQLKNVIGATKNYLGATKKTSSFTTQDLIEQFF